MSQVRRLVLEVVGWVLVVAGVAALVLPGPGLLLLFAGLAVLSRQYAWAERRLRPVEAAAKRAAAQSVQTWPRIAGSVCGALAMGALGALWLVSPPPPGWWPAGGVVLAARWAGGRRDAAGLGRPRGRPGRVQPADAPARPLTRRPGLRSLVLPAPGPPAPSHG